MGSNTSPSTSSASPPRTSIKKEAPEEEIKEYAETAMNELLGWYGYERVDLPRRWTPSSRTRKDPGTPDSSTKSPERKDKDECSWCNSQITTDSSVLHQSGAKFCSELCFSQSRRANFKRAKTCDWCRHIRHTVSYVDFQDGATQLQFCSDKCLNQYKMHIFCRETQAHLDLNPHLAGSASTSNLITPDLWLKNCRSRSTSPTSEKSPSPSAENLAKAKVPAVAEKPEQLSNVSRHSRISPLPVITIAPSSKLLKSKHTSEERIILQTSPDHKKNLRSAKPNLRKRRSSRCSSTVTSQSLTRQSDLNVSKAQDLRMCSPPSNLEASSPSASSTVGNNEMHSPTQPMTPHHANMHPPNFSNLPFGIPPSMYMEGLPQNYVNDSRFPPPMFPPPNMMPRPGIIFNQERPRVPVPPLQFQQLGFGNPPPVTVLVPYPVVLPIPFPIPVPIPLQSMLHAYNLKKTKETPRQSYGEDNLEEPLDFTMNGHKKPQDDNGPPEDAENNDNSNKIDTKDDDIRSRVDDSEKTECSNPEQTLPRFKITRLGTKMPKIVAKPRDNESTRPLRKRRRLVEVHSEDDCAPLLTKPRKIVQV